jgi:uncharacterized protein YndB with AHSA1/START domain
MNRFTVERTVVIRAPREVVFRYFQDPERWARWWGAGSTIESREGGAFLIRYPNGETASGRVVELSPPERFVFTFGYDAPGKPIPPGGSRVSVRLEATPEGTRLSLAHEAPDKKVAEEHVQGWRYQLALFSNVVAAEQFARCADTADHWFAAWSGEGALDPVTTDGVEFRDAFSAVLGRDDLAAHLRAAQMHMPGVKLRREGEPQQCQGTVLCDWVAEKEGAPIARGTNLFELAPDGRISRAIGFWKK